MTKEVFVEISKVIDLHQGSFHILFSEFEIYQIDPFVHHFLQNRDVERSAFFKLSGVD